MALKLATRIVAGLVVVDAQLRGLIDASNCFLDYTQDCRETGRCCSAKMSCYEKDSQWSACLPYCIAGQAHNSDADSRLEHPGPWSCREVLPTDQFLVAQAAKTLLLSREQLRSLYSEKFKRFDQDNSSTMDLNEFRHLLREKFQQRSVEVSEDLVQKIWKDLDPSHSGAVNFTEFCRWYFSTIGWGSLQSTANSLGRSTEEIARLYYGKFKDFDAGQSGTMEMNEFRTLLQRVLGREVQEHVFTTLWNDLDRDGTGSATFHDFSKWYFQWMSDRPSMDMPQFNRYEYDQFQNKGCAVGSFALKDGMPSADSAMACKQTCSNDPRCDIVEYVTSNGHCQKRHFYGVITKDASGLPNKIFLKDVPGTNLYMKLAPAEDPPAFQWQEVMGILTPEQGNLLMQDSPHTISYGDCRDLCARSRFCNCFAYSSVSTICNRYIDCQSSQLVPDSEYKVYFKVASLADDSTPWWSLGWWILMVIALIGCFCLGARYRRKKEGRAYAPVTTEPELEILLENSSKVERWPGSCGACGCACGRPPFWIPATGAVVVLPAEKGVAPKYSSTKRPCSGIEDMVCSEALKPADVILRIGDVFVHSVQSMEQVIKSAKRGNQLDLVVLRPRGVGEYKCSSDHKVQKIVPCDLDMGKALQTHKEVKIVLTVQ